MVMFSPRGVDPWNIYGYILPERGCLVEHIRLCSPREGLFLSPKYDLTLSPGYSPSSVTSPAVVL